jgi:plastocyanin
LFKSWQIFVFSLVPLALVFAGVIIGSMHGTDSELQVFPTQAPRAENGEAPGPTPVPGATQLHLVAENLTWSPTTLSAPAATTVQVVTDNRDAGVQHNFALYADRGYTQIIYQGELVAGPVTHTDTFDTPSTPGQYFFRCDVHPDQMTGGFTVN